MEQDLFLNEFDRQYGDSYRNENSSATNPENQLPGNSAAETSGESTTPKATADSQAAQELAQQVAPKEQELTLDVFGHPVTDYINTMLPNGAPEGSRHKFALKIASDAILLFDGDMERVRQQLQALSWVQDIIRERGMNEIDRIIAAAKKRMEKRESENLSDPQPSKDMRRAIEMVTGRKYSILVREQRAKVLGQAAAMQDDILQVLERIGLELKKLMPYYPLLQLLWCLRHESADALLLLFLARTR